MQSDAVGKLPHLWNFNGWLQRSLINPIIAWFRSRMPFILCTLNAGHSKSPDMSESLRCFDGRSLHVAKSGAQEKLRQEKHVNLLEAEFSTEAPHYSSVGELLSADTSLDSLCLFDCSVGLRAIKRHICARPSSSAFPISSINESEDLKLQQPSKSLSPSQPQSFSEVGKRSESHLSEVIAREAVPYPPCSLHRRRE